MSDSLKACKDHDKCHDDINTSCDDLDLCCHDDFDDDDCHDHHHDDDCHDHCHDDHCHDDHCHDHCHDHRHDDCKKCCIDNNNCIPKKNNCNKECCNGLPKTTPDLSMVRTVPILANRVFDCMRLESPHFALKDNAEFKVTSGGDFHEGDRVCIDKICVKFDIIGAEVDCDNGKIKATTTTACSKDVNIKAVPGTIIRSSSGPYAVQLSEDASNQVLASDEERSHWHPHCVSNNFMFNVNNNIPCEENCTMKKGRKCKVIEQGIRFRILNLRISVSGRAGCLPFTAVFEKDDDSLKDALGFPEKFNFFGKLCIPRSDSGVPVKEKFEACLSVDCIDTTDSVLEKDSPWSDVTSYNDKGRPNHNRDKFRFFADIESSLLIVKTVYSLIEEKLSVLTIPTPRRQECHDSGFNGCRISNDID